MDLYGFGKSKVNGKITLFNYAKGIIDIIENNKLNDVTLVGHSFGGKVAMLVASIYNIKKLVLIDASGIKKKNNFLVKQKILIYKLKKFFKLDVSKYGSLDYKNVSSNLKDTFISIVNTHLNRHLKNIKADTLILWGNKDEETPLYMAKKLNKKIKNSCLIMLNGGHFAYAEDSNFIIYLKGYLDKAYAV